jgi:hypothetical protein
MKEGDGWWVGMRVEGGMRGSEELFDGKDILRRNSYLEDKSFPAKRLFLSVSGFLLQTHLVCCSLQSSQRHKLNIERHKQNQ